MNNKKVIIAIVGKSASGKSYLARQLERKGIPQVVSRTTRPPRYMGEEGHVFLTPKYFDQIEDNLICQTTYGGYKYGCLDSDISELCTYVIDEKGIMDLDDTNDYVIIPIFVKCSLINRFIRSGFTFNGIKRVLRDLFKVYELEYDITVTSNRYNMEEEIILPICRLCHFQDNNNWEKFNLI